MCHVLGRAPPVVDDDEDEDEDEEDEKISVPLTITMTIIGVYIFFGALLFGAFWLTSVTSVTGECRAP